MKSTFESELIPTIGIDDNGRSVIEFEAAAQNFSKIGILHKLIADMFESEKWREYKTGAGRSRWLECEYDYFLIATGIKYDDACAVFRWTKFATTLAASTMSEDSTKRRKIAEASVEWSSGVMETLVQAAERLGWLTAARKTVKIAASSEARSFIRNGSTIRETARKNRIEYLGKKRCRELNIIVDELVERVPDVTELRFFREQLDRYLRQKPQRVVGAPLGNHKQWTRDIKRLNGDTKALAEYWGITTIGASYRQKKVISST